MNIWLRIVLVVPMVAVQGLFAQDGDTEDVFELSPFSVDASSGYGYYASSTLAGSRLSSPNTAGAKFQKEYVEIRENVYAGPETNGLRDGLLRPLAVLGMGSTVPVALVKPADDLAFRFAVSFYDDDESVRKKTLLGYLERIKEKVETEGDLRFEAGQLILARGDRKKSIRRKKSSYTSHAHFTVYTGLEGDASAFEKAWSIRSLLDELELESEVTKLFDGPSHLVLKRTDQYRPELLKAIFQDVNALKEGLGEDFEVRLGGLSGPVLARPHSEREVELWIQYDLAIRSVREFEFEQAKELLRLSGAAAMARR